MLDAHTVLPSGEKATCPSSLVGKSAGPISRPAATSQSVNARGFPPASTAAYFESGEKAISVTHLSRWYRDWGSEFVIAFHRRTVPSLLPETMVLPSGENAAAITALSCPIKVTVSSGWARVQRLIFRSLPAEARHRPSGEKATLF